MVAGRWIPGRAAALAMLVVLGAAPAWGDGNHPDGRRAIKELHRDVEHALSEAQEELSALEALIGSAADRRVQKELYRKVERIGGLMEDARQGSAAMARMAVDRSAPPPPPVEVVIIEKVPEPEPEPEGPWPVEEADFRRIHSAISEANFDDDKLEIARSALADRWFTTGQVKELMGLFSFGDGKIDIAAMLYPRVVDPQQWFEVYSALTFDSEKKRLRELTR